MTFAREGSEMSLTGKIARFVADYDNPRSVGSQLRAKRIAPLLDMMRNVHAQFGEVRIIDVGGTQQYWGIVSPEFLRKHNATITIVNVPGMPLPPNSGPFRFAAGDGCDLATYGSDSFHIAHSNSVIEHVGRWDRMVAFAREIQRVAPCHYVQTPNFWFPVEPHFMTPFFHWLPPTARVWLLQRFALGQYEKAATRENAVEAVNGVHLIDRKSLQALFPTSRISTEMFFGLPKSLVATKE